MFKETDLNEQLVDVEKAAAEGAARAARGAEAVNQRIQRSMEEFNTLMQKLKTCEDEDEFEDLEGEASELAEALEIEFAYVRADGDQRKYTPEAFWEPSGGCSWVESAQAGYDYGWNI